MREPVRDAAAESSLDFRDLLKVALEAAREALTVAGRYADDLDSLEFEEKHTGKSVGADVVSVADREVETSIRAVILRHRPQDTILGEEGGLTEGGRYVWTIDPIDGTLNYSYGRNEWAVSIAVSVDGQTVAGVVATRKPERYFTAVLGGGAFLNGKLIRPRQTRNLSDSIIDLGRGRGATREIFTDVVAELDKTCRDVRRGGCAALAACQVACGELDAMYGPGLEEWDIAAGALIALESGASVRERKDDITLIAAIDVMAELERVIDRVIKK